MFWEFYWIIIAWALGLCIGSFYNVLLWRLPAGLSVLKPGSHCPRCQSEIRWYDNVPVFAWLIWLKRKCRVCSLPIPFRYPLVELLGGIATGGPAILWSLGWVDLDLAIQLAVWGIIALPVVWMDFEHFLIPVSVVWCGAALILGYEWLQGSDRGWDAIMGAGFGAGGLWLIGWGVSRLKGVQALGEGDVDLMLFLGALVAWQFLPILFLGAAISALLALVYWTIFPQLKPKCADPEVPADALPFGPFLCAGAFIALVFGVELNQWYWNLVLP
jgi:leader peptidase (prepilin peptidase)/N-methyltransferase